MIDSKNIQQHKKLKILLIGDSCIDEYRIGTVDRLSPEAPVPVVKIIKHFSTPGMAANVKINLEKLGIDVDFITNDEDIIKMRFIDERSSQHLLRVDTEPNIKPWDGKISTSLDDYDAIVISDYNKGFLTYSVLSSIRTVYKGPIFIDTKKQDLENFHGFIVKINEQEYKACRSTTDDLIVTLGGRGAMYKKCNIEKLFHGHEVEVVDVCGCGDTFLAALSYQYLQTGNLDDAIIFANKAASITVQHRGNYTPSLKEINNV